MAKHAKLSPSGSHKWIHCPAAPRMEQEYGHQGDLSAANEGTAAHFLAAMVLEGWTDPNTTGELLGKYLAVDDHGETTWVAGPLGGTYTKQVDHFMLERVLTYTNSINRYLDEAEGVLFVEVGLPLQPITGEEGAEGTADAVILADDELQVHDLKYGRTPVRAKGNTQLMVYALAAYSMFGAVHSATQIRLVIHQPNVDSEPDDYTISIEELLEFGELLKVKSALGLSLLDSDLDVVKEHVAPGEHCEKAYCKARAKCAGLARYIDSVCDFDKLPALPSLSDLENNPEELARYWKLTKLVRGWADQIESYIGDLVIQKGAKLPGLKVVRGRDGSRKWVDEQKVREEFTRSRVPQDVVFPRVLISPTQADKAAKEGKIKPALWERISEQLVTRSQGALTIAPVEDKRPAVQVHHDESDFENLENVK